MNFKKQTGSNTGTSDKNNPDIRFSIKEDKPFNIPTFAELDENLKRGEAEASKNYDIIKNKINNIKEKYKTDKVYARESIKAVQSEIIKYANRNIPYRVAGKKEVIKLLTMVENTNNPDKLFDVFLKIDDFAFGIRKKRNIAKIENQEQIKQKKAMKRKERFNFGKQEICKIIIALIIGISIIFSSLCYFQANRYKSINSRVLDQLTGKIYLSNGKLIGKIK